MKNQTNYKKTNSYQEFLKPLPAKLLVSLKMDKAYTRAEGNYLFFQDKAKEVKVLDFAGGYGSLILGHNHPELIEVATKLLTDKVPSHAQLSIRSCAASLGKALNDEIAVISKKQYVVTFANTGAEAVEAAIKHANLNYYQKIEQFFKKLERELCKIQMLLNKQHGTIDIIFNDNKYSSYNQFKEAIIRYNEEILNKAKPAVLASKNSFHGKTLAALSITYSEKFRKPFAHPGTTDNHFFAWNKGEVMQLFDDRKINLEFPVLSSDNTIKFKQMPFYAVSGVIIEPILGEGGVYPVPSSFLKFLREVTQKHKVPLIFDEIQSGFYRTGHFLVSLKSEVFADYYLLGKAMGGGIAKISALIVDRDKYKEEFGLLHTSTFAEDDFSSKIALKALKLTRSRKGRINSLGMFLKKRLQKLQREFESIVEDVRGEGLMLAVEFKDFSWSQSYGMQLLARSGYFSYIMAAFLLNNFNIRVAPTLSASNTVRIQPSAFITKDEIEKLLSALSQLSKVLYFEDIYKLIEFTLEPKYHDLRDIHNYRHGKIPLEHIIPGSVQLGFITHYINIDTVKAADPSLEVLDEEAIEGLMLNLLPIAQPVILGRKNIMNNNGSTVSITFAGLPFTSGMARRALLDKEEATLQSLCQKGVDLLEKEFNVSIVGLGQFSSILSNNGNSISNSRLGITNGHSFTVHIGIQAILNELKEKEIDNRQIKIGIIGAGGNICSTYAQCFAKYASEIYLLGSDSDLGYQKSVRLARNLTGNVIKYLLDAGIPRSELEETIANSNLLKAISENGNTLDSYDCWEQLEEELDSMNPIKVATIIDELYNCNVIVVATNQSKPYLKPEHFNNNTIVYDISVPVNCTMDLINNNKNIKVIMGGIVALPNKEKLPLKGFPLQKGFAFACISETLLLGLENSISACSTGVILPEQVELIGEIGAKHGFVFAKSKLQLSY